MLKRAKMEGLPLLSPYFVTRTDVIEEINAACCRQEDIGMKVLVVIGMAGSGKTQIVSKFMRANQERYDTR